MQITSRVVLGVLVGVLATSCQLSRSFEGQGRIVGFGSDGTTVFIEHEDIDGFMPAMTMPFTAADSTSLTTLGVGDAISFTLVVTRGTAWIEDVQTIPASELNLPPPPELASTDTVQPLIVGESVPEITLINQDGETFALSDFGDQYVVVTFIYTRCPIPDFCPLMSRHFQTLQRELHDQFPGRVHQVSISFDAEYDTPAVLRDYAKRYTQDLSTWTFATGTLEEVEKAATLFGVSYTSEAGVFDHNLTTAILSPDQRILKLWRGNDWSANDVLDELTLYLKPSAP